MTLPLDKPVIPSQFIIFANEISTLAVSSKPSIRQYMHFTSRALTPFLLLAGLTIQIQAQDDRSAIEQYLIENQTELGYTDTDISNWKLVSSAPSKSDATEYRYTQQMINQIPVFNDISIYVLRHGAVIHSDHQLIPNAVQKANTGQAVWTPERSYAAARQFKDLTSSEIMETEQSLVYYPVSEHAIRLAYHVIMHTTDKQHVWSVIVDAVDGTVLNSWDHVLHCNFEHGGFDQRRQEGHLNYHQPVMGRDVNDGSMYNVFALPVESPNHGIRSILSSPADSVASPFGWHDNDAQEGANFTITRGNNAHAYEDASGNNNIGYSPDGGPNLQFDYSLDLTEQPGINRDAAITNLFYTCNVIHDVLYQYGFDEASGNFQANNYGNGGSPGDIVRAEALDGSGLNNANFFTPGDGQNPRMQMYLWNSSGLQNNLYVNEPNDIAGGYISTGATFGPGIPTTPLSGNVVLYDDGDGTTTDACQDPINSSEIAGNFVLIDRQECTFISKILKAQSAGATGVIMVNNVNGAPITMGGSTNAVNIPSVMVSQVDGELMRTRILDGITVNATMVDSSTTNVQLDGSFDNGVIVHEYGHGISNRLIGGRFNSNCMINSEQMGEGWSDWYAMMLTMDLSVANPVYRPIGTYVSRENPNGFGIRPAPYDTSMVVNGFTYSDIGDDNISVPHGVGFIWATMLWELTWIFIDEYGFDPDLHHGTGGNNMMLELVTEALKITSCGPGFKDGRDAILQADINLNGGANTCLIWKAFAKRGMGFSASQGSPFNVRDGSEAFDIPESCEPVFNAFFEPDALESCNGSFSFTDQSLGEADSWAWDFGDGNTSDQQNPDHTYTDEGDFIVTMTVTFEGGVVQSHEELVTVEFLEAPSNIGGTAGCIGESLTLTAVATEEVFWYDADDNLLGSGSPFTTAILNAETVFKVSNKLPGDGITCESERIEVPITLASADFTLESDGLTVSFTDQSTQATSWSWSFGDNTVSNEQNPVHTYDEPGNYDVQLTVNDICSTSDIASVQFVNAEELYSAFDLRLLPNPTSGLARLTASKAFPASSLVELIAMDGRIAQTDVLSEASNEIFLDLTELPNGTYLISVTQAGEQLVRRPLILQGNR